MHFHTLPVCMWYCMPKDGSGLVVECGMCFSREEEEAFVLVGILPYEVMLGL